MTLRVHAATFGLANVTSQVNSLISSNQLNFTANTNTLSPPGAFNGKRCFYLVYQYDNGDVRTFIAEENSVVTINAQTQPSFASQLRNDPLWIVAACWGKADVTTRVRSFISNNRLEINPTNTDLTDGWHGNCKTLTIVYQQSGQGVQIRIVQEDSSKHSFLAQDFTGSPIIEGDLYYICCLGSEVDETDYGGKFPSIGGVSTRGKLMSHQSSTRVTNSQVSVGSARTILGDDRRSLFWSFHGRGRVRIPDNTGEQAAIRTFWGHYLSFSTNKPTIQSMNDSATHISFSLVGPTTNSQSDFCYSIKSLSQFLKVSSDNSYQFSDTADPTSSFVFIPVEKELSSIYSQAVRTLTGSPAFDYRGNLITYGKPYYIISGWNRVPKTYNGIYCNNPALYVVNTHSPHTPVPSAEIKGNDAPDYDNNRDARKIYWFFDDYGPISGGRFSGYTLGIRNVGGGSLRLPEARVAKSQQHSVTQSNFWK